MDVGGQRAGLGVLSPACPNHAGLRARNLLGGACIPSHLLSWQVTLAEGKPLPPQPQLRLQRRQGQLRTGGGDRRGRGGITASQSVGGGEFRSLDRTQSQRGKGHAQGHIASQWAKRSWCLGAGSPGFKSDLEQITALICKNTEPTPCLLATQGHGEGSGG